MNLFKTLVSLDADTVGVPVDIVSLDDATFRIGTSRGFLIDYSVSCDPAQINEISRARATKNGVRRSIPLKDGHTLVATDKGTLRTLSNTGKSLRVECETNLGNVCSLCAFGEDLYLGNDSGDIFIGAFSGNVLKIEKHFDHHDDYISALVVVPVKRTLLAASGDGSMSVIDLKRRKLVASTKNYELDITSVVPMLDDQHYLLATAGGWLRKLKWNYWNAPVDTLKGKLHQSSPINGLVVFRLEGRNEELAVTVDGNGFIRMLIASPLGIPVIVGQVEDSLERVALIQRQEYIVIIVITASDSELPVFVINKSEIVKTLDLDVLTDDPDSGSNSDSDASSGSGQDLGSDPESDIIQPQQKRARKRTAQPLNSRHTAAKIFFEGLD